MKKDLFIRHQKESKKKTRWEGNAHHKNYYLCNFYLFEGIWRLECGIVETVHRVFKMGKFLNSKNFVRLLDTTWHQFGL
jgi:hypothetical protein